MRGCEKASRQMLTLSPTLTVKGLRWTGSDGPAHWTVHLCLIILYPSLSDRREADKVRLGLGKTTLGRVWVMQKQLLHFSSNKPFVWASYVMSTTYLQFHNTSRDFSLYIHQFNTAALSFYARMLALFCLIKWAGVSLDTPAHLMRHNQNSEYCFGYVSCWNGRESGIITIDFSSDCPFRFGL